MKYVYNISVSRRIVNLKKDESDYLMKFLFGEIGLDFSVVT